MATIIERVTKIITDKLGTESNQVTMETRFTTDLGADSLDVVEVMMDLEKEFNISIPDEQAEKMETVGQVVEYIDKALGQIERQEPNVAS